MCFRLEAIWIALVVGLSSPAGAEDWKGWIGSRLAGSPEQLIAPTALSPRRLGVPGGWVLLELDDGPLRATAREAGEEGYAPRALG